MKIIKYITIFTGAITLLSSCRDYVEIDPVGNSRVLRYTSDYRALANNYTTVESGAGLYAIASDDVELSAAYQAKISDIWTNIYTWQPRIFNESQGDPDWNSQYLSIYYANVLIDGVMDSEKGTEAEKKEIKAEAYVNRAYSYLQLVNIYAPQYDMATAKSDKAVPLLLTPDLYTSLDRATVEAVYNQIFLDLKEALSYDIQNKSTFNTLPSKTAVYALFARAYLQMGIYDLALENAQKALELQNGLIDLGAIKNTPNSYPVLLSNPEVILSKKMLFTYRGGSIAASILNSFGANDARYAVYTAPGTVGFFPTFDGRAYGLQVYSSTNGINVGPSVPEMYLIAAECNVRLGNFNAGIDQVNVLRKKRFTSGSAYSVSAANKEDALDLVIAERKKEFVGRGFRWFDQKRLNKEERYKKTVTRVFKSNTFTLEPNSAGYVFPINQNYIDLNPELGK